MENTRSYALVLLLFFACSAFGDEAWSLSHKSTDHKDPNVYVKKLEGQNIKAFKGIIAMPYSPKQIVSAIEDRKQMPKWVYQCKMVKENIVENDPTIYYSQIQGIWPVQSRDVVLKSKFTRQANSRAYRGYDKSIDGILPPKKGFIRLPKLNNNWHIYPAATKHGWSIVEFATEADLGGTVPSWLANMAAIDAPRKTLSGLRELLDSGNYGKATAAVVAKPKRLTPLIYDN